MVRAATTRKPTIRKRATRRYYDVVLRGTFEARFDRQTATSAETAKAAAFRELKNYAARACNGGSTVTLDNKTSEAKTHVPKFNAEIRLTAKDEDEARQLLKTLGDKVVVDEVYKERVY